MLGSIWRGVAIHGAHSYKTRYPFIPLGVGGGKICVSTLPKGATSESSFRRIRTHDHWISSPPALTTKPLRSREKLKPSAHRTIFVAGSRDLVFCRQRRKRLFSIFDIEDRRQRQKSFVCVSRTLQLFVASDKNLRPQRRKSCCVR